MSGFIIKIKSTDEFIEKDFNHGYLKTKKESSAHIFPESLEDKKIELSAVLCKEFIGLSKLDLEFLPVFKKSTGLNAHQKGLAVVIRTEDEFNKIKEFLGDYLYLSWVPQMANIKTSVVIYFNDKDTFSIGSIGVADYQEEHGIKLVEFSNFFK